MSLTRRSGAGISNGTPEVGGNAHLGTFRNLPGPFHVPPSVPLAPIYVFFEACRIPLLSRSVLRLTMNLRVVA